MLAFVRRFASLNAVFQCLVGAISIASPAYAATLFGVAYEGHAIAALIRMFGGLLFASGLASAVVAYRPEKNPWLPPLVAVSCVVNVATDALVCAAGDMKFSQLAVGMILQILLAMSLVAYSLQPRRGARA